VRVGESRNRGKDVETPGRIAYSTVETGGNRGDGDHGTRKLTGAAPILGVANRVAHVLKRGRGTRRDLENRSSKGAFKKKEIRDKLSIKDIGEIYLDE